MAYGFNDDKTKASFPEVVVLSKDITISLGTEGSYSGQWSELEALGVSAQDWIDGKWSILSVTQTSPQKVMTICDFTNVNNQSMVYPRARFAPYGTPYSPEGTFTLYGYNPSYSPSGVYTVTVVLMKVA